jgi:CheY-specific phosphatase CheX
MPTMSRSTVVTTLETTVGGVLNGLIGSEVAHGGDCRSSAGQCLLACVGMRGGVAGVVSVAAPLDLCADIARDRFGVTGASGADREVLESILGEIASVAAGCMATCLEAVESTWLTPPVVTHTTPEEWNVIGGARNTSVFDVDGRQVLVSADVTI